MRIVLLAEELRIGGLPNYVLMLAHAMPSAGFEVLVAHGNAPLPAQLEVSGLTLAHLPGLAAGADDAAIDEAMVALRAWSPDIVHVHLCSNVAMIRRLLDSHLPLVRTLHDYTSLCLRRGRRRWSGDRCQRALGWSCAAWGCFVSPPRPGSRLPSFANLATRLAERNHYRSFGASIVTGDHMARTLRRNGFPDARIHVVPYFTRFEAEAADPIPPVKPPGIPGRDRPLELLFAGQALPVKGLETLMEALAGLHGDWRLSVLAEGQRLAPARAMVEAVGLAARVSFLGWATQSETRNNYRKSDVLVFPSLWDEPFGLVGIEAMSFGTPVVGFAVGGISDYLLDKETGLLVRETTADALRAALTQVIDNPEQIAVWGRNARNLVTRTYTKAVHLAALRRIYIEVRECSDDAHRADHGIR